MTNSPFCPPPVTHGYTQMEAATSGRHQGFRCFLAWHPSGEGAPLRPRGGAALSKRMCLWSGGWPHGPLRAGTCDHAAATNQAHVRRGVQHAAAALTVRRARGDQRLRWGQQHIPQAQAWSRQPDGQADGRDHDRGADEAQVGATLAMALQPAEWQRDVRAALEAPQAEQAARLDAAELLSARTELELGGAPGGRRRHISSLRVRGGVEVRRCGGMLPWRPRRLLSGLDGGLE